MSDNPAGDPASTGSIYFATPDGRNPAGGIRQIYRIVDALNAAGADAAVVHSTPGFRCEWFSNTTTVRHAAALELSSADLLVVPELWAYRIPDMAPGIPKVIYNQNQFNTFRGVTSTGADLYYHPDVRGAIVSSDENASFLRFAFPELRIELVRYGLDFDLFHPDDAKSRAIAYMPRKRAEEAAIVMTLLRLRGSLDGWELVPIDGAFEAGAAAILRRSRIFLCFSHQEGFGLPPAEAMAAGCIVVGFDGFGGRELFREHGIAVPEGDLIAFVQSVEGVLGEWDRRSADFEEQAARASDFVRRNYTMERGAEDAVRVFGSFRPRHPPGPLRVPLAPSHAVSVSIPPSRWRVAGSHVKAAMKAITRP